MTNTSAHSSSPAESSPPAASIDFNATADCLDQFSGSGATRGTEYGAQTAQVAIPKDSGWDTFVSVIVFVFPTDAAAKKFSKTEDRQSTMVIGDAVISGSALEIPYSKGLVLGCLKTS